MRVVPNRYPILAPGPRAGAPRAARPGAGAPPAGVAGDGGTDPRRQAAAPPRREERPATGDHEVVVLSPDHHRSLADLSDAR